MDVLKLHILYEHGLDLRPHSSAFIRLLRPLTHPVLSDKLKVSTGLNYSGEGADAVIVDRLWQPYNISLDIARRLVSDIKNSGARFIYTLDDDFLELASLHVKHGRPTWFTKEHSLIVKFWLQEADAVIVTTPVLKARFESFNENIHIIPNMLDDRLLVGGHIPKPNSAFPQQRITIGYMGTHTHDQDLQVVLPALQEIERRYSHKVEFQMVGGVGRADTLKGLTFKQVNPPPDEIEYPLFMLWFTSRLAWDIAIAPLKDTSFNRSKSDLKFLDYSAIGSAGVYSRCIPYQDSVQHQHTGWLAQNTTEGWIEALETLITQPDLRRKIAQNAIKSLYGKRVISHNIGFWLNVLS